MGHGQLRRTARGSEIARLVTARAGRWVSSGLGAEDVGSPDLELHRHGQAQGDDEVDRVDPRPGRRAHARTVPARGRPRLRPWVEEDRRVGGCAARWLRRMLGTHTSRRNP